MEKIDKRTAPSLTRIKARAKAKSRAGAISLGQAQEQVAQAAGFSTFRAAVEERRLPEKLLSPEAVKAVGLDPAITLELMPCHWVVIGGHVWYLQIGEAGPELWRHPLNGVAAIRVSQLGIFQALRRDVVKSADGSTAVAWSTARYCNQNLERLDPWTDEDAEALTLHFGLPVVRGGWLPRQKELSEELFLCSYAFRALRRAIRAGRIRPRFDAWDYGLTNIWNLLVAMPDEVFLDIGQKAVAALFALDRRGGSEKLRSPWREVSEALEEAWPYSRFGDPQLQEQIANLLPPKLGQRMRAHLVSANPG